MSHLRMTEEQLAARAKKLEELNAKCVGGYYVDMGKQTKVAAPAKIKQKKVSVPTEHQEQCKVIQWCDAHPIAKHIFAIPNGSNKSPAAAAKFKREGLRSGVPDLFLAVPNSAWNGLFIEMKRTKGSVVSEEQIGWHRELAKNGYAVRICKGADEAILEIKLYLILAGKHDTTMA